jgi:glycosyltransferase involved in cell wall biosynthesis
MRIAQVAPLYESVPPEGYGGTERVVSFLTEELVRQGHSITLFASGDSKTRARLVPACPRSLRLDPACLDRLCYHILQLDQVRERAAEFDVIHFHIDYLHFPLSRLSETPHLTTLHGRLDLPDLVPLYRRFADPPVVSISDAQRSPLPWINWQRTVYHGLPEGLYSFHPEGGRYLAFLGRISPEKRADRAIAIARRAGMPLKIAAKIDSVDKDYFEQSIRPLLSGSDIEFVGEIGEGEKDAFLGNAYALLFPIDWPEPFGLVMIEALACGTPVVAWNHGSVPEIIAPGTTGFICQDIDEAVEAVKRVSSLSRRRCRQEFESRFCAARMAGNYVQLYERLIDTGKAVRDAGNHPGPRSVLHSGVGGAARRTYPRAQTRRDVRGL